MRLVGDQLALAPLPRLHLANHAAGGEVELEHTVAQRVLEPVRRELPILRAGRSLVAFPRLPRSPTLVVELADLAVEHEHTTRFEMCQHAAEPFEVLISRPAETERAAHHHRAIPARQIQLVRRLRVQARFAAGCRAAARHAAIMSCDASTPSTSRPLATHGTSRRPLPQATSSAG